MDAPTRRRLPLRAPWVRPGIWYGSAMHGSRPRSDLAFARRALRRSRRVLVIAALALGVGCGGGGGAAAITLPPPAPSGMSIGTLAPAFALSDVNPASVTFATDVAPSQYVGSASAWYFGHAT